MSKEDGWVGPGVFRRHQRGWSSPLPAVGVRTPTASSYLGRPSPGGGEKYPSAEEREFGAAEHLVLDHSDVVDPVFGGAEFPWLVRPWTTASQPVFPGRGRKSGGREVSRLAC